MKLKNIYMALGLSLLLPLGGCINDDMPPCTDQTRSVPVRFTITLSNTTTATRAENEETTESGGDSNAPFGGDKEWGGLQEDEREDGYPFDNRIENVKVFIYSLNSKGELDTDHLIGSMTASGTSIEGTDDSTDEGETSSQTNYSKYTIFGTLETDYSVDFLEKGKFRMVVIANSGETSITDLGNAQFTRHGVPQTDVSSQARIITQGFTSIPMYGVGEVSFDGLSKSNGETFYLKNGKKPDESVSIPMLRSMAKIRVKIGGGLENSRKMKLHSLTLSRHSAAGYYVPSKWNSISTVYDMKLSEFMNVIKGSENDSYPQNCSTDTEGEINNSNMIRFYVPDTYNIDNNNQFHDHTEQGEIVLTVTYYCDGNENKGDEKKGYIYLRPYSGGEPVRTAGTKAWDIIRNHIYEYEITNLPATTGDLLVKVAVKEWVKHDMPTIYY